MTYFTYSSSSGRALGSLPRDSEQAFAIAAMKSSALNGLFEGPVSRSVVPLRIRILVLINGLKIASPTPRRTREGMVDVKREPML